jgi:protein SCO1/2
MKRWFPIAALPILAAAASPVAAHALKDVESALHGQERYAQFVDTKAPDFQLTDFAGNPVNLTGLKGRVVVLNFIYSRCTDVCPLHMVRIAKLQSMVNTAGMQNQVQFVTIATDEEDVKSTRQIMAGYAKSYGLDTRNWRFLYRTSAQPAGTTRQVAEAYGLKFTPAGKGVQMHGVVTHVIDQTGRLRARFHGLKFEPVHLVSYVNALANDDHSKQTQERLKGS